MTLFLLLSFDEMYQRADYFRRYGLLDFSIFGYGSCRGMLHQMVEPGKESDFDAGIKASHFRSVDRENLSVEFPENCKSRTC